MKKLLNKLLNKIFYINKYNAIDFKNFLAGIFFILGGFSAVVYMIYIIVSSAIYIKQKFDYKNCVDLLQNDAMSEYDCKKIIYPVETKKDFTFQKCVYENKKAGLNIKDCVIYLP